MFRWIVVQKKRGRDIVNLLRRAGRGMGLKLCFHDRLRRVQQEVPRNWRKHCNTFCNRRKAHELSSCMAFDVDVVHQALSGKPEGRIHDCPFGVTELAVPVMERGLMVGVLFAGPCWRKGGALPSRDMVVPPNTEWLKDRLVLLRGVARLLGELMRTDPDAPAGDRRLAITSYVKEHLDEPVYLGDLARHLSLSPSRMRHAIHELFDQTFSDLVRSIKLQESAYLLRTTDLPVGEIAARVGFDDPAYFARLFRRQLRVTPRVYRRQESR